MEEARQHSSLISDRFGALLLALIIGEILSVLAVLVFAFTAPNYVSWAVHALGAIIALRMAAIVIYGLVKGMLPSRGRHIQRVEQPTKFWIYLVLYLNGVAVGLFLTQVPIK